MTRSGGVCRLEIGSVLPLHAGTYLCQASNPAGEACSVCRVDVKPGEPKQHNKRNEPKQQQQQQQPEPQEQQQQQQQQTPAKKGSLRRHLPPSFVQIFVDQEAEPGDEVLFECIINGWPKPAVGPRTMVCCMLGYSDIILPDMHWPRMFLSSHLITKCNCLCRTPHTFGCMHLKVI